MRSTKDTRILDDRRVDELLAGDQPAGDPELRGLGAAIVVIRDTWGDSEVDLARAANIASDLAAAAVEAEADYVRPPATTGRRRRKVAASLAGGLAASLLLTGGLAAAEVLPDGAQRVVADLGDAVGVDLPDPASDKAVDATSKEKGAKDKGAGEKGGSTAEGEGGEGTTHPDNHGKQVSEAAHDHSRDEECGNHGKAVSSVARGEETCTPPGEGGDEGGDDAGDTKNSDSGAKQGKPEDAPAGAKPEAVPPVPPAPPADADDDATGAEPAVPSDAAQDRGRPDKG